jgi:hypothetical protein
VFGEGRGVEVKAVLVAVVMRRCIARRRGRCWRGKSETRRERVVVNGGEKGLVCQDKKASSMCSVQRS